MSATFDLGDHPVALSTPRRLTDKSAWVEHIPFGMLVVDLVRPSLIVELGTHNGDSYCSFCQAVQELGLASRCFAVDTWEGDDQTGFYGPEILQDLRLHHDHHYAEFSALIQSRFDGAVNQFADGSIDLLHIDGWHTYEAVRHDFETWEPKLSRQAVVLLHDTNVREGTFGVWRFWAELAERYPHFEFAHGHGLGVASVGPDEPPALERFREAFATPWVPKLFSELGQRLSGQLSREEGLRKDQALTEHREMLDRQHASVAAQGEALAAQQELIAQKDAALQAQHAALQDQQAALGVLRQACSDKDTLLTAKDAAIEEHAARVRALADELDAAVRTREAQLAGLRGEVGQARAGEASARAELERLRHSLGHRIVERTIAQVDQVAPWSTKRRQVLLGGSRAARLLAREGVVGFTRQLPNVRDWVSGVATVPELVPAPPTGPELSLDEEYQHWLRQHTPSPEALQEQRRMARRLSFQPTISILVPVHNTDPTWLRAAVASVRNQTYPRWELCIVDDCSTNPQTRKAMRGLKLVRGVKLARLSPGRGISGATNRALGLATGEFVGLLDHDDELKPNALFEVVSLLNRRPDLDFIYSDEDKREPDGRLVDAFFKPDWSPELLLAMNYVTHFSVYRRSIVNKVGGLRPGFDGSQDHDLILRVSEKTERTAHIALPLYTWRKIPGSAAGSTEAKPWANTAGRRALTEALDRRGLTGEVTPGLWKGSYRVRFAIEDNPRVAIIIPTRDRVDLLRTAVESIQSLSTYRNYEVIVVDNQSTDPETLEYLSTVKGRVLPYPHRFHYAAMMNEAAREARADYLVFLNNDTEVITPGWIEAMLEYAQQPPIAAVGARLRHRDGSPQHEGVVLGVGGTANNVDHREYFGQGSAVTNVSAVTAACMMTRMEVYEGLHGMEENLAVAFNDVDYCLRALAAGYRIVYTPYAELYHDESATRGSLHPPADEQFFRGRWGQPGEYIDAYYNPNLDDVRAYHIRVSPAG